jgi:hypothetical protein
MTNTTMKNLMESKPIIRLLSRAPPAADSVPLI